MSAARLTRLSALATFPCAFLAFQRLTVFEHLDDDGAVRIHQTAGDVEIEHAGDLTAWCFHGSDELGKSTPGDLELNLMTQASNSSADPLTELVVEKRLSR